MTTPMDPTPSREAPAESSDGEAWYDAEIAPVLAELGQKIQDRGMSIVAVVEYAPGERGATYAIAEDAGLEMRMLHRCSATAPNVDAYIIGLRRYCNENGIKTDASIYLSR